MNVEKVVRYWREAAEEDWPVAEHLFDGGDYRYALFIGHLYLEKLLKALVVQGRKEHAPRSHNLLYLAQQAGLEVEEARHDELVRITLYNIATRYPDDLDATRAQYSRDYTRQEIEVIKEIGKWLTSQLEPESGSDEKTA